MARLSAVRAFGLACAAALFACGGSSDTVTRLVGGRTIEGPFVPGDAYGAFLRGAIAEEQGRYGEALAAYDQVLAMDAEDPEPWARVAAVRCAMRAGDPEGARAAERALAIDPDYGPAHLALARCAGAAARTSLERAARAEPAAIEPQLWLARIDGGAGLGERERDRILALALAEPSAAGLAALGAWAAQHGAPWTAARAWIEATQRDASRADEASQRALMLAGDGELVAARALCGALADLRAAGRIASALPPLAARLAVDEALARGDAERARARAPAARVGLDEVAGRAILLGHAEIALPIAELVAAADPGSVSARLALVAAKEALGRPVDFAARTFAPGASAIASSVRLAYARALARRLGPSEAARALGALQAAPVQSGDALEVTLAVELAARGVLVESDLPLDARVELAIRNRGPFAQALMTAAADPLALDARHRLAFLAWTAPASASTAKLAARLTSSGNRDPLVIASVLHVAAATKASTEPGARDRLIASAPADPLVCAAGVEVAPTEQSKRRLAAVAATKAEHDLATY